MSKKVSHYFINLSLRGFIASGSIIPSLARINDPNSGDTLDDEGDSINEALSGVAERCDLLLLFLFCTRGLFGEED